MPPSLEQAQDLLPLIPLAPLVGAIINGLLGHRLPRRMVSFLACAAVLVSFVVSVIAFAALMAPGAPPAIGTTLYRWVEVGTLSVDLRFAVDPLSGVMILVVTGVGFLIHVYSVGYMAHENALARYFAYLNLFMFAMLVLVLGSSLPVMFVGWEGVGLCSYLLIGFWYTDVDKAAAGKKAFVVNRIGDFGFIVAMLILFRVTGSLDFEALAGAVDAGQISTYAATAACLLLVLGATGKSAQIPLFVWLPDAMAGPTPVSALIHAATMVTAGVYMTARMGFLFAAAPVAMVTLAFIGAATALFAATIGTTQNDIKKVLAYSTVSQLGFMFIAAGVGAYAVALFHVVTHAFFKACLFLGSGSVIHGMGGEQDIRQMGGLRKKMPYTFATFFVATMAITGFPLMSGFISKDAILWNAYISAEGSYGSVFAGMGGLLWVLGVVAAGFTAFYMWRLVFLTFFSGELRARPEVARRVHESPASMTVPLVVLAFLSVVGGVLSWPHLFLGHAWLEQWLASVVGAVPTPAGDHVALEWALMTASTAVALCGFGLAFWLYAVRVHPFAHRLASARPWLWVYERLLGKWHVDELYQAVVVQPLQWCSRVLLYEGLDRRLIDGTINLAGWLAKSLGFLPQVFQSGNIQRYLAVFAVGLAILLYGWLTPSGASFSPVRAADAAHGAPAAEAGQPTGGER